MVFSVIIFSLTWVVVFGQFQDSISFGSNEIANRGTSDIIIVNPPGNCECKPACIPGPPPPGNIDIRIVNNGPSPIGCPVNQILCCASATPPPANRCGVRKVPRLDQPVVGQASFASYPWHAVLLENNPLKTTFLGSGVLLSPSHVLTAAHKVASYVSNPKGIIVRLGEWNGLSASEPIKYEQAGVAEIIVHPGFNAATLSNDVAIIRLTGNMPIDENHPNINTACQPITPPVPGQRCWVTGWGKNKFEPDGQYQKIMREVDVPLVDVDKCEAILRGTRLGPGFNLDKNSFMCAGGEIGKDACTGDGGAPLVCEDPSSGQWRVVGLVAWGIGCGSNGVPGVYTNIFNFLPWINQYVK